jgi:biotin carboxyl carrier protein
LNTYHITVNGKQYTVEIDDPTASPVSVQVDGHPFEVTLDRQGGSKAKARPIPREEPDLEIDAYVPSVSATYQELDLDVEDDQAAPTAGTAEGAATVNAPMPGTILDIAVQVGDRVGQGDTLCNLEAMKMKSPIRSPGKGTVAQVLIAEGQNVGYGEALFVLGD